MVENIDMDKLARCFRNGQAYCAYTRSIHSDLARAMYAQRNGDGETRDIALANAQRDLAELDTVARELEACGQGEGMKKLVYSKLNHIHQHLESGDINAAYTDSLVL